MHSTNASVLVSALAAVALATVVGSAATGRAPIKHDVRPGPGVTVKQLSDYLPALRDTAGDTAVFVMGGDEPGGTVLVVGGTHGNELAGIMSAVILVEHAHAVRGRLVVIPNANNAAMREPAARRRPWVSVKTAEGSRRFRFGARLTPVADQGRADPKRYVHPGTTESLPGREARNLNRVYPGDEHGTLTEQVAAGIVAVLRAERVDLAFDLHESGPGSRVAWTVMAGADAAPLVESARLALDAAKLRAIVMPEKGALKGMSLVAWPDAGPTRAFLLETPSPAPTRRRPANEVTDSRLPLARRVGAHLAGVLALVDACSRSAGSDRHIVLRDVPSQDDLARLGVGAFLR